MFKELNIYILELVIKQSYCSSKIISYEIFLNHTTHSCLSYNTMLNEIYFSLMNHERLQSPLGLRIIIFKISSPWTKMWVYISGKFSSMNINLRISPF